MTYCVGLLLNEGLVLASDTRTNAGVDQVAVFPKMHRFEVKGERVIVLLTAGNLAITQSVVTRLQELLDDDHQ
ncbi:MAG: peptidase, partial [Methylophilaceae bacterium]